MPRPTIVLILTLLAGACAGRPAAPPTALPSRPVSPEEAEAVVQAALALRGVPYRNGGSDPRSGFDCSGLVQYVYAQNGIDLPRTAAAQGAAGTPTSNPQPGDLVIQNGGSHVGIYLGNGQMISALNPSQGTQVPAVSAMSTDYYASF